MTRKLNQADLWLIRDIEKNLSKSFNLDIESARSYIEQSNFKKFLYEKPEFTHHEGMEKWVKSIANYHELI